MILGNTLDTTGESVAVHLLKLDEITKDLNVFFFRRWSELIDAGHASPNFMPTFKGNISRILYLTINGEIAGHILFEFTTTKDTFIHFTVVEEKFRRRGLYKIMHKFYDGLMRNNSVAKSKSQLHVDNTAIIDAAQGVGYKIEYYRMVKQYP